MKMKWMVIVGGLVLVSLSGCDKLTDMVTDGLAELEAVTEEGWKYTTKVDKLTQIQSVSATREFTDKDVDFVLVKMELMCENSQDLFGTITTYDTRADKDGNMGGATMSYDSDKANAINTRSGKNIIRYLVFLPDYSNELTFNVAQPGGEAGLLLAQLAFMGIVFPKESASLMVENQWIIRVDTELGNPTVTVNLNDPAVKKVTDQCNWHPAFSNSKPAVNTDSSTATEKTKDNSNETEKGYIQTKATLLGYAERDWGCTSDFIINGKKVEVEGCPKDKMIYENNEGKALTLTYKTGMVEGFKTYYFVDAQE